VSTGKNYRDSWLMSDMAILQHLTRDSCGGKTLPHAIFLTRLVFKFIE
jgi:hypothetical protein